jgi:hypothetical protein
MEEYVNERLSRFSPYGPAKRTLKTPEKYMARRNRRNKSINFTSSQLASLQAAFKKTLVQDGGSGVLYQTPAKLSSQNLNNKFATANHMSPSNRESNKMKIEIN